MQATTNWQHGLQQPGVLAALAAALLFGGSTESVFTALLAWFAFRENFDRRMGSDNHWNENLR